jgi:hypothetical protein
VILFEQMMILIELILILIDFNDFISVVDDFV